MIRKLNLVVFVALSASFLSFCSQLIAQPMNPPHSKLNTYLSTLNDNQKVMTAVYVSRQGQALYEYYAGFASMEDEIPLSDKSKFRIGSITKTFTAVLIMQLVEAGKLSLDTKLAGYYPNIDHADKITIEHLLRHRSGIRSYTDEPAYIQYMTQAQSRRQMEQRIGSYPSEFRPGKQHQYSNSNYLLLGYIIETLYDKPYAQVVKEKIVQPLGLSHTYFGDSIAINDNEAHSYLLSTTSSRSPETHMSVPHAAGAIVSSAKEVNGFIDALFEGKLVSEKSLKAMMTLKDGYGLGMFVSPFYQHKFYGHNGSIDGFVSATGHNPADGTTLTVLSNGVNYNFNDVLVAVLSSVYGRAFEIPDFSAKPITLSLDTMHKVVGNFASKDLPLEIRFSIEGNALMAQATGQGAFPLTPYSETEFKFDQAGIVIQFDPNSFDNGKLNRFILNQGGGTFRYKRE